MTDKELNDTEQITDILKLCLLEGRNVFENMNAEDLNSLLRDLDTFTEFKETKEIILEMIKLKDTKGIITNDR